MFPGPAPGLDPLLPGGHRTGLHHRGEARRRAVHPPVGLLLAVGDDLVPALPVLVQLELLVRLHAHKVPLAGQDLLQVVVGLLQKKWGRK